MYIIVYTTTTYYEDISVDGKTKVYFCKKKKLACNYLLKRLDSIIKSMKKKEALGLVRITDSAISNGFTYGYIEYETGKSEYPYVRKQFEIVRGSEILDLPNGPGLKAE